MTHEVVRPQRRSIRLRDYDYAQPCAYFVTIVTRDRKCLFGDVVEGYMRLNQAGRVVQTVWGELPDHYPGVECDSFVVMPNHVHGLIMLAHDVGAGLKSAPTLAEIIRGFKTFSARRINELRATPGVPIWQRNYYEHVVRGEKELSRIREYIANNPLQWEMDRENPNRVGIKSVTKIDPWEI